MNGPVSEASAWLLRWPQILTAVLLAICDCLQDLHVITLSPGTPRDLSCIRYWCNLLSPQDPHALQRNTASTE